MELPLFVQSSSIPSDSPVILLGAGDWSVEGDMMDVIINLSVDGALYKEIKKGQIITVPAQSPARASIVKGGSEKHITLYLKKCQLT